MYWLLILVLGIGLNLTSAIMLLMPFIRRRRAVRNALIVASLLGAMTTIGGLAGYFIGMR